MARLEDPGGFLPAVYLEGSWQLCIDLQRAFADPAWAPNCPPLEAAFDALRLEGRLGADPGRN